MKGYFCQICISLVQSVARCSQVLIRLRRVGDSMCKVFTYFAPFTVVACAGGPGYIGVPNHQNFYFYEPSVTVAAAAAANAPSVQRDSATIDLTFKGSKNTLSVTTMASRGDRGLILGSPGKATDYTGILALDAAFSNNGSIPMRLWVGASCPSEEWVILPGKLRLVDTTRNSTEIPLSVYLQPNPAVLHPDSQVFTAHWQYTRLDPNEEIRCQKGGTVAFTVGFDATLTLSSLKIVLADSLQRGGEVIHIPDVELSLTAGKNLKSTNRVSILEIFLGIGGGFAR